jgi:hypothetical protein
MAEAGEMFEDAMRSGKVARTKRWTHTERPGMRMHRSNPGAGVDV